MKPVLLALMMMMMMTMKKEMMMMMKMTMTAKMPSHVLDLHVVLEEGLLWCVSMAHTHRY